MMIMENREKRKEKNGKNALHVTIKGKVIITNAETGEKHEIENTILLRNLIPAIRNAFKNSIPTVNGVNRAVINGTIFVSMTPSTSSGEIIWTGQFKSPGYLTITSLDLYIMFQTEFLHGSSIQGLNYFLPPGTYYIEWIWQVTDPVGVILYILQLAITQTLKSVTTSFKSPSAISFNYPSFPCGFTIMGVALCTSGTLTYDSVTVTVSVENTSSSSTSFNIVVDTTSPVTLECPNEALLPVSIVFST